MKSPDPGAAPRLATAHSITAAEFDCEVIENDAVNPEYMHIVASADPLATSIRAGQFFHMLCPKDGPNGPFFRRPMSVYRADPEAGTVAFLYKVTGSGTRALATLAPGDRLDLFGPLGVGFSLEPGWRRIVVVGRGVGLATLAPLAELAAANGIGVTAILSARSPAVMMSAERFAAAGADVIEVTDAEGTSGPARLERVLRGLIADGRADAFFTCGPNRLLLLLQRLGREFGIPGQVALEQQMACGLGMCFCCVREFRVDGGVAHRRVCWDGPVFDLQEAISW